jgi:hypothetical protein
MRTIARINRAAVTVAVVLGVSSVSLLAEAGQGKPEQGKDQAGQAGQTQESQNPGTETRGGAQNPSTEGSEAANTRTPGTSVAALVTATATIEKIDKSKHTLMLKSKEGNTFEAKVGPAVDLDRLKVGDRVTASYFEEVAVAINKHPAGPPKAVTTNVLRGGVTAQQATITAKIDSVDADKKTITFRGPEGVVHTLKVSDPALQAELGRVHAGENMDVTYTQAVAVSVEPPAKAPTAPAKEPPAKEPPTKEPSK